MRDRFWPSGWLWVREAESSPGGAKIIKQNKFIYARALLLAALGAGGLAPLAAARTGSTDCPRVANLQRQAPRIFHAYYVPTKGGKIYSLRLCVETGQMIQTMIREYNLMEAKFSVGVRDTGQGREFKDQREKFQKRAAAVTDTAAEAEAMVRQRLLERLTMLRNNYSALTSIWEKMLDDVSKLEPAPALKESKNRVLLNAAKRDLYLRAEEAKRFMATAEYFALQIGVTQENLDKLNAISVTAERDMKSLGAPDNAKAPIATTSRPPSTTKTTKPPEPPPAQTSPPASERKPGDPPPSTVVKPEDKTKGNPYEITKKQGPAISLGDPDLTLVGIGVLAAGGIGAGAWALTKKDKKDSPSAAGTASAAAGPAANNTPAPGDATAAANPSGVATGGAASERKNICYLKGAETTTENCLPIPQENLPIVNGAPSTVAHVCTSREVGCVAVAPDKQTIARSGQVLCVESKTTCGPPLP